jgi:hypothetical protein
MLLDASLSVSKQTLCGFVGVAHRRAPFSQAPAARAMPEPVVAAAYVPSAPGKPDMGNDMGNGQPLGLSQALSANNLSQYEAGLRDLGVTSPSDVQDLVEADCLAIGMKPLEVKRLLRIAGQTVTAV